MIYHTKFLGVLIDDKLHFSNHINQICKKISRSIGVIKKLSAYLPQSSLITLYYSIVYPHVIYAIKVWGSSSQTQLNRLRRLLDKCLKIYCRPSHNGLKGDGKFLKFDQIYNYFLFIRTFNYYTMTLRPYFREKFQIRVTEYQYNIQFSFKQILLHIVLHSSKKISSFFHNEIRFWNKILVTGKNLDSVSWFRKYLMKHTFENPWKFFALWKPKDNRYFLLNSYMWCCILSVSYFFLCAVTFVCSSGSEILVHHIFE